MIIFALQLIAAHIIGDFVFQPSKWVEDKKKKKHRSKYLYFHIGVHALALLAFLKFDLTYWPAILVILSTHFMIDVLKLHFTTKKNQQILFIADQALHISVIVAVVCYYYPIDSSWISAHSTQLMLLFVAFLCLSNVAGITMQVLMSKWKLEDNDTKDSLKKAGKYIGILERIFVFGFIVLGQWQGIGWLLAAKSIFRFGDLSRAKDRKLTEYILIGTMLSFGFAILVGLAYNQILAYCNI